MAKFDILIAEDDTVLRDLYLRKMNREKYDVRTAENGQTALDMILTKAPNLLLLDINMPILDGFELLEKLPVDKRTFPVIILTNLADQFNRERGAKFNVADYFVKKDMTVKMLIEMIEKHVK
ncbi:MAG: response regulator [Candidatus Peribacteraceae bacterium]